MQKNTGSEEQGDCQGTSTSTTQETPEVDWKTFMIQLQQSINKIQNDSKIAHDTLQQSITDTRDTLQNDNKISQNTLQQTITDTHDTLHSQINQIRVETQNNFDTINIKISEQEKNMHEIIENFKAETRNDLDHLHQRVYDNNERMRVHEDRTEEKLAEAKQEAMKNIEQAISPVHVELKKLQEEIQKPVSRPESVQVVVSGDLLRPEAEQRFFGDGRANPKVFFGNLKAQVQSIGRNSGFDLKRYLRGRFSGDAELWFDIVKEDFVTLEDFEKVFMGYYWGQEAQAKIRDNLYNGRFNETFGTTRERYAMRKFANARNLEPSMPERDIIAHLARHFEEEICDVVTIHQVDTVDKFLTYLRRIDDARRYRRKPRYNNNFSYNPNNNPNSYNNNFNPNRREEGRTPHNIRGGRGSNSYPNQDRRTESQNDNYNNNGYNKEYNNKGYDNKGRNYNNYQDNQRRNDRFYQNRSRENSQERRNWEDRRMNASINTSRNNSRNNSRSNSRNTSRESSRDRTPTRQQTHTFNNSNTQSKLRDTHEPINTNNKQIHFNDIAIVHKSNDNTDF